ncbi:hypothetical protein P2318_12320 [Myxococcaceae bacterium GXIMD 01537]
MSPRPSFLTLLGLTLAAGCGPAEPATEGARFGLELTVERAVAGQLGSFQVVVLPSGQSRNCTEIQRTCLRTQVKPDEPLTIRDASGRETRALKLGANIQGTTVRTQDLTVEVPVGRDYALVIEALSTDNPPRFLGSSCNYLREVNAGVNQPVLAAPMTLTTVECDPTFAP